MQQEAETVGLDTSQLNFLVAGGNLPSARKMVDDAIAHSRRPVLLWALSAPIANPSIFFPNISTPALIARVTTRNIESP